MDRQFRHGVVVGVFVALSGALAGCATHGSTNFGRPPPIVPESRLSGPERAANCTGLASAMASHAASAKTAEAAMAVELRKPAATIERMVQRANHMAGLGTYSYSQVSDERHAMAAIADRVRAKGCPAIDIDAAIARAVPTAVKPCAVASKIPGPKAGIPGLPNPACP